MNLVWMQVEEATMPCQPDEKNKTDRWQDPDICWEPRRQARSFARLRSIPALEEQRKSRLRLLRLLLRCVYTLSLWVTCGGLIAAVLVCRNDDALLPIAKVVVGSFLIHLLARWGYTNVWFALRRMGRGR